MSEATDLATYYAARAAEYERVYAKPERQADLALLRTVVGDFARGRRVLEVACGTGYWTKELVRTATTVVATDVGEAVLALARAKQLPLVRATFLVADAFHLDAVPGEFDAGFAGFWWSHVRRDDLQRFLGGLHSRLGAGGGARVMVVDNRYVEGNSTPIARADAAGNTYQQRVLANGTEHEVLKNFPGPDEVRRRIEDTGATAIELEELSYYWYATYTVASQA